MLRAGLLRIPEESIENHDDQDCDGLVRKRRVALDHPERPRDGGRGEQQDDKRIGELPDKFPPTWNRPVRGKLVRPVARQARPRLVLGQPDSRIARRGSQCCLRGKAMKGMGGGQGVAGRSSKACEYASMPPLQRPSPVFANWTSFGVGRATRAASPPPAAISLPA